MEGEDKKLTYKSMLMEIIDVTIMNISGQFCDVSRFKFFVYSLPQKFPKLPTWFPHRSTELPKEELR